MPFDPPHDSADENWLGGVGSPTLEAYVSEWVRHPASNCPMVFADNISTSSWSGYGLGPDATDTGLAIYTEQINLPHPDYLVEGWFTSIWSAAIHEHSWQGVLARWDAAAQTGYLAAHRRERNYVLGQPDVWDVFFSLYKIVAGVVTQLGTYDLGSILTNGTAFGIRLKVQDTTITMSVTGLTPWSGGPGDIEAPDTTTYTDIITVTDSAVAAKGAPGFYFKNLPGNGIINITRFMVSVAGDTDEGGADSDDVPPTANLLPQLWLLTDDRKVGRWQAAATSDMMVNQAAGEVIPDWVYSTGFDLTTTPTVIRGMLIDSSGAVDFGTPKSVEADGLERTREFSSVPAPDQDESWEPCAADFAAQKFRAEFSGSNSVTLRRAMWEREAIEQRGG